MERYELQPADFQTNGPQLLYRLRYHTHLVKPGEAAMFHDQVGYWLWEPATGTGPDAGDPARPGGPGLRSVRSGCPDLHRRGRSWVTDVRDRVQMTSSTPRSRLCVPHDGDRQRRRQLVVRGEHAAADPRPRRLSSTTSTATRSGAWRHRARTHWRQWTCRRGRVNRRRSRGGSGLMSPGGARSSPDPGSAGLKVSAPSPCLTFLDCSCNQLPLGHGSRDLHGPEGELGQASPFEAVPARRCDRP